MLPLNRIPPIGMRSAPGEALSFLTTGKRSLWLGTNEGLSSADSLVMMLLPHYSSSLEMIVYVIAPVCWRDLHVSESCTRAMDSPTRR